MKNPRRLWLALLVILVPVHAWLAVKWIGKWGFWGAIWHWLESAKLDPIYATGVIDFLTVMGLVGLWLLADHRRRGGRVTPLFLAWCAFYLIWPSLGILVYWVWMRRDAAHLT